jgi:NAD(P)-dependent dehydrogenase (short-subunit alcohol dehydrogenase family)
MENSTINASTAFVTGASRGIGRAISEALLERGVRKLYAGVRDPRSVDDLVERYGDRVVPLVLDVTDTAAVAAAAEAAGDTTLLVNNAGVALGGDLVSEGIVAAARQEMEVNYFAPLEILQRFAPILKRNGGGAVVNMSSIAGLSNFAMLATYSASKAAVHSLTQATRALLAAQKTAVFGVYPGPVDTDMAKGIDMDKTSPEQVAVAILDGVEAGVTDIYPDPFAEGFGQQFEDSPRATEKQLAGMVQ